MGSSGLVWEWHLHCPVIVTNCVFRTLLMDDHLAISDTSTIDKLKSLYRPLDHEVDITGGIVQGVRIPPAFQVNNQKWIEDKDVKVNLVNQKWVINDQGKTEKPILATIEDKGSGLLRLHLTDQAHINENLIEITGGSQYLLPEAFLKGVPDFSTGAIKTFPDIAHQNVQHYNTSVEKWAHTYAFLCPVWPQAALGWYHRERKHGWPSKELMDMVKDKGCYVVPKTKSLWEYSFPLAERRLMNSLSPVQKHIFTLLKIICFQKLGSPCILTFHMLRANFLRMCEEIHIESWRQNQTTTLLMHALDSMLHQIINDEFPDYFIAEKNLLDGISEDFLDVTQIGLAEARSEALKIFIQYNLSFQFESNHGIKSEVFEPILDVTENKIQPKDGVQCILQILIPFLIRLTVAKADKKEELNKAKGFEALDTFRRQFENVLKENNLRVLDAFWQGVAQCTHQNPIWNTLIYEYILEKVKLERKHSFFGNLGCMYHAGYTAGNEEYKAKAQGSFEAAMKEPTVSSATRADYVLFLCDIKEWQRAKELINDVLTAEELGEANCYEGAEVATLHPTIQTITTAIGGQLSVQAVTHMYFLRLVHEEMQDDDLAKERMISRFKETCEKSKDIFNHEYSAINYTLLGLAMEKFGKVQEAKAAYLSALNMTKDDKLKQWLREKKILEKEPDPEIGKPELKAESDAEDEESFWRDGGSVEMEDDVGTLRNPVEEYDEEKALAEAIRLSELEQNLGNQNDGPRDSAAEEEYDEEEMLRMALELSLQQQD